MKDFEEFEAIVSSDENKEAEKALFDEAIAYARGVCDEEVSAASTVASKYADLLITHRISLYHDWAN